MKKDRDAYIVIAPSGKSKTYSIAAKRISSSDRYSVVATCQSDILASRIVAGLNLLQGEVTKLEVPAQRLLEELRSEFAIERSKLRTTENELRQVSRDLATMTDKFNKAEAANKEQA